MDAFFLCWAFDRRWLCNFKNPCYELIFTIPLVINLGTGVWIYVEKRINTDNRITFLVENLVLLALLALSDLYMILIVRLNSSERMNNVRENYVAIQEFHQNYELKKVIWSFIGFMVTIITVSQTIIQQLFVTENGQIYDCLANKIRLYLDFFFYAYILAHIGLFLIVKAFYLCSAWVCCPHFYLKLKRIVS